VSRGGLARPAKAVPARLERELLVRAPDQEEALKRRTAKEIVQAVQTATGRKEAVAARRLRSGDVVITLTGEASWYVKHDGWAKTAFGPTAQLVRRTHSVVAKGVPREWLEAPEGEAIQEIRTENKVDISILRVLRASSPKATTTMVVLGVTNITDANKLCDNGMVWRAQLLRCEPLDPQLRPRQCYNCYGFGHIARFCEKTARCPLCAGVAHAPGKEGEQLCPSKAGHIRRRCAGCNGAHAAFERSCPVAKRYWDEARERYSQRACRFEDENKRPNKDQPQVRLPTIQIPDIDGDGFMAVRPIKRKRGPKTGLEKAGEANGCRISFGSPASTQAGSTLAGPTQPTVVGSSQASTETDMELLATMEIPATASQW
jgi:hypothetical protein